MQSRNLRNLKIALHILRIQKLHATCNLEIVLYVSTIHKRNELMVWECLSWIMEESWELSKLKPWTEALHRSGSLCVCTQTEEKGVGELPRSPWCGGREYMPDFDGGNGATKHLYTRWKLQPWSGFNRACNRNCTISRLLTNAMQSRDCITLVHNLEIGKQFPNSENAQRNHKIVQIPRFCGTCTLLLSCPQS